MNIIKTIATTLLLTASTTALAQYDDYGYQLGPNQGPVTRSSSHYYSDDLEDGWGTVYLEYSPVKLKTDVKDFGDLNLNGFTIGCTYAFRLGESPLYLESGVEGAGAFFRDHAYDDYSGYRYKYGYDIYSLSVPLNMVFRIGAGDNFAILPYAGIYGKAIILATEFEDEDDWDIFEEYDGYKRFQFGVQGGLKFQIYNAFTIGASYKADLTPFYSGPEETQKFSGFSFSIGYSF